MERRRLIIIVMASAFCVCLLVSAAGCLIAYFDDGREDARQAGTTAKAAETERELRNRLYSLKGRMNRLAPTGTYIIVDTANNILSLNRSGKEIRQTKVSCGSGSVLEDPVGGRKWVFETPRGEFTIRSKARNPVWIKPDWAFIEEGTEIPKKVEDRMEEGVLGDYALGFGNGYFIHGTLYTRLIGRNVSHGCIRVGDKDLEEIYKATPEGSRLIIF